MAKKIQLNIAEPCHENWDGMTPVEKGRFCGSCQKQVVDFSDMSDRQIAEFFKKPSTGSVCGRFMTDQLDRPIEMPKKRIPWVKYFFQITLPAFLVSLKASANTRQGQVKIAAVAADTTRPQLRPKMGMVAMPRDSKADTVKPVDIVNGEIAIAPQKDTIPVCTKDFPDMIMGAIAYAEPEISDVKTIEGMVINQQGEPVLFASIQLGKSNKTLVADEEGLFRIKRNTLNGSTELTVSCAGYQTKKIMISKNYTGKLVIELKSDIVLPEVVVTALGNVRTVGFVTMGYTVVQKGDTINAKKKNETNTIIHKDPPEANMYVYPNPVAAGASVNINFKEPEEGYYQLQLINPAGQTVHQREIWIDAEARIINTQLPSLTAGTYFLVMVNRKSGKKYSEKIIVQ